MKKLSALSFFTVFIAVFALASLFYFSKKSVKPCNDCNVILISVDALRADHMGVYGYKRETTPNIDKWAKGAFVFNNMQTVIPSTLPSFAAFMTGVLPFDSKLYNNFGVRQDGKLLNGGHPIQATTLSEVLRDHDYKTQAYVTNESLNPKLTNMDKGFDKYNFYHVEDSWVVDDKQGYENFFNNSINWLQDNKNDKFFLWLHFISPHAPYTPPPDFQCKFTQGFCDEIKSKGVAELEKERKANEGYNLFLDNKRLELFEGLYDGEIAYDDSLVGKVLKKIEDLGLDKKTIVIFYGDHGEGFDHDYYFTHSLSTYESHLHIPFIIKLPNYKGKSINTTTDNTQAFSTILDLLGIKYSDNKLSLIPLMGKNLFARLGYNHPYIYSVNTTLSKYVIQDGNYKYSFSLHDSYLYHEDKYKLACYVKDDNLNKDGYEELYSLKSDPEEHTNIVLTRPDIAQGLKTKLMKDLSKYQLPQPIPWYIDEAVNVSPGQEEIINKLKSMGY